MILNFSSCNQESAITTGSENSIRPSNCFFSVLFTFDYPNFDTLRSKRLLNTRRFRQVEDWNSRPTKINYRLRKHRFSHSQFLKQLENFKRKTTPKVTYLSTFLIFATQRCCKLCFRSILSQSDPFRFSLKIKQKLTAKTSSSQKLE